MRCSSLTVVMLAAAVPACAQDSPQVLPPATQIALAVQAGPEAMRDGATVQGYDASGEFVTLREGTNELICMAPNPTADRFEVSCHHASLERFFERGRELTAAGVTGQERLQARWAEHEAGDLPIPAGTTNYIMTGSGFDPTTFEVQDSFLRWVIYTPGATPETTGLPTSGDAGAPWLMFPGTPGSHIMIVPPRAGGG